MLWGINLACCLFMLPFPLVNWYLSIQLTCHHHRDAGVPDSVSGLLTPPSCILAAASHLTSLCLLVAVSCADTAVSPHRYRPGSRAHRHTAKPAVTQVSGDLVWNYKLVN